MSSISLRISLLVVGQGGRGLLMVEKRKNLLKKPSLVLLLSLFATTIPDILIVCLLWVDLNDYLISSHIPVIYVNISCRVTVKHTITEKFALAVYYFKNLDSISTGPKSWQASPFSVSYSWRTNPVLCGFMYSMMAYPMEQLPYSKGWSRYFLHRLLSILQYNL